MDGATITIAMGGTDMSTYYSNGKIAIPNVTGDIVITATAVPSASAYTNLADPSSEDWKDGYRITSTGIVAQSGKTTSNPIDVVVGDVIRVKGVNFAANVDRYQLEGKNSEGTNITNRAYISALPDSVLEYSLEGDIHTFTVIYSALVSDGKLRFAFSTPTDASAVIITRNEEIN